MKNKLINKSFVLGTWVETPSYYSINVIAKSGLDFVIIDMEHGVSNFDLAQNMVISAQAEGVSALIRVPKVDESYILRALDSGCDGIIVPQVKSYEDVERIVEYAKYAPIGKRGFNPFVRAGNYSNKNPDYTKNQNENKIIGVILESLDALNDIEKIAANEYIDVIYLGQYDLSLAFGKAGDIKHPKVLEFMDKAIKIAKKYNKHIGYMVHSANDVKEAVEKNIKFLVYKTDTSILFDGYNNFINSLKEK